MVGRVHIVFLYNLNRILIWSQQNRLRARVRQVIVCYCYSVEHPVKISGELDFYIYCILIVNLRTIEKKMFDNLELMLCNKFMP